MEAVGALAPTGKFRILGYFSIFKTLDNNYTVPTKVQLEIMPPVHEYTIDGAALLMNGRSSYISKHVHTPLRHRKWTSSSLRSSAMGEHNLE